MRNIKASKGWFVVGIALLVSHQIWPMEWEKRVNYDTLKQLAKTFLVSLYYKNQVLEKHHKKKKALIRAAIVGKEAFEDRLKRGALDFEHVEKEKLEDMVYVDTMYKACTDVRRFNQEWE